MPDRPRKFHGPTRNINCRVYEAQFDEIKQIAPDLTEQAGFFIGKADLVRMGIERVLSLPADQIISELKVSDE